MQNILSDRHASTLASFASSNVLLAFDFDGTLAPIADEPSRARMRLSTRRLLAAITRRYPAVVISGRSRADLVERVGSVPVWHLAGNYGLEPWWQGKNDPALIGRWVRLLEKRLNGAAGIHIEDKTYSVTVHYRQARDRKGALAQIRRAIHGLPKARALAGVCAISIVPRGAPDKGDAVEHARRLLVCDTVVYVGDDDTDETVFRAHNHAKLLAIRVGRNPASRARFCLTSQREIDRLLQRFLAARPLRGKAALLS